MEGKTHSIRYIDIMKYIETFDAIYAIYRSSTLDISKFDIRYIDLGMMYRSSIYRNVRYFYISKHSTRYRYFHLLKSSIRYTKIRYFRHIETFDTIYRNVRYDIPKFDISIYRNVRNDISKFDISIHQSVRYDTSKFDISTHRNVLYCMLRSIEIRYFHTWKRAIRHPTQTHLAGSSSTLSLMTPSRWQRSTHFLTSRNSCSYDWRAPQRGEIRHKSREERRDKTDDAQNLSYGRGHFHV